MALFKEFGLIDIIFISLCMLITYEAAAKGFFLEILKLIGLFFAIIFSFHFYPFLAFNIAGKIPFLTKDYAGFLAFCFLFFSTILVLDLLSRILNALFKRQMISSSEKAAAIFAGFLRVIFLSSVISFIIYLLPVGNDFLKKGLTGRLLQNIAPKTYLVSVKSFKKIQPNFKANEEVEKLYEAENNLSGNNKKGD
jgi:uncharacterized membrane protein required for colicin V production